ncbi:MAG: hypothetical protein KKA05_11900 [Alphaproteobacteria bacterium]|nr:hypothetical protein [Alphaproteobacteria bacterium]
MDPFTAIAGASLVQKLIASLATFAIIFTIGFGAAEAWEHRGPQGWPLSMAGKGLKVQRDEARADRDRINRNLAVMTGTKDAWKKAQQDCEAQRRAENQRAADEVSSKSDRRTAGESRAFDNGFAAGRAAGRKSCGAPNAPSTPVPDPRPKPGPGSVRQDQQAGPDPVFGSGAYRPGG